jgi:hypothetical protein
MSNGTSGILGAGRPQLALERRRRTELVVIDGHCSFELDTA